LGFVPRALSCLLCCLVPAAGSNYACMLCADIDSALRGRILSLCLCSLYVPSDCHTNTPMHSPSEFRNNQTSNFFHAPWLSCIPKFCIHTVDVCSLDTYALCVLMHNFLMPCVSSCTVCPHALCVLMHSVSSCTTFSL